MTSANIYAVRSGRECAIYTDLAKLQASVLNFHHAEFNAFKDLRDADSYLATYASLYSPLLTPPVDKGVVVMQTFAQPIEIEEKQDDSDANGKKKKFIASATACFGCNFVALSDTASTALMECTSVFELLKALPKDDESLTTIVLGSIEVAPITIQETTEKDKIKINYETMPIERTQSVILKALEDIAAFAGIDKDPVKFEDGEKLFGADLFKCLCDVVVFNSRERKNPVRFRSSHEIAHLHCVRIPTVMAADMCLNRIRRRDFTENNTEKK